MNSVKLWLRQRPLDFCAQVRDRIVMSRLAADSTGRLCCRCLRLLGLLTAVTFVSRHAVADLNLITINQNLANASTQWAADFRDTVLSQETLVLNNVNWHVSVTQDDLELLDDDFDDIRVIGSHRVLPGPNPLALELTMFDVVPGIFFFQNKATQVAHGAASIDSLFMQYAPGVGGSRLEVRFLHSANIVDRVINGLLLNEPGAKAYDEAVKLSQTLTLAQATDVAVGMKNRIVDDGVEASLYMLRLYKVALKRGKNPFIKSLGAQLAGALEVAMPGLGEVLKKSESQFSQSRTQIFLESLSIPQDEAFTIATNFGTEARRFNRTVRNQPHNKEIRIRSDQSAHFTFAANDNSTLSFDNVQVESIFDLNANGPVADVMQGAVVEIPTFHLSQSDVNAVNQVAVFDNRSNAPMRIVSPGGDVFLELLVGSLLLDEGQLLGMGSELVLSGSVQGSHYDEGLGNHTSDYIDEMHILLDAIDFENLLFNHLLITPDTDLWALTNGFSATPGVSIPFSGSLALTVPELRCTTLFFASFIGFLASCRVWPR